MYFKESSRSQRKFSEQEMQELTVGSQSKCNVEQKKPEPRVLTVDDDNGALTASVTTTQ